MSGDALADPVSTMFWPLGLWGLRSDLLWHTVHYFWALPRPFVKVATIINILNSSDPNGLTLYVGL